MTFLYTVIPPEELWADDAAEPGWPGTLVETSCHGVPVLARRTNHGAIIERLLTTDPYLYLRPELSPGTPLGIAFRE